MTLSDIIKQTGIPEVRGIPLSACTIRKQYLLDRLGFTPKSVYINIIPYYARGYEDSPRKNVSAYAASRDYHLFAEEAGRKIIAEAEKDFPGFHFAVFADHSPIDEREAAARAGLGIIGDNGLLITPKFSSFVFLCEIVTDMDPDTEPSPIYTCEGCGKCKSACPANGNMNLCLSAVTQKKGDLDPAEARLVSLYNTAWGCDICQNVCPHTISAKQAGTIYSSIPFFNDNLCSFVTKETLADEEDFKLRAYSWRGHAPIERNLTLLALNEDKK